MQARLRSPAMRVALALTVLSDCPTVRPADLHAQSARRLDALLDAAPFRHAIWGVALVDERGRLLYGRNADRMMIPASNTKLVVTAVAAALLPPDFTVNTSLYGTGPVRDGILEGDLVLYGRGDPAFGSWVTYGLGSESQSLPAFVVLLSRGSAARPADPLYARLWGSGFLPSNHQGVAFRNSGDPVLYLSNPPGISDGARREQLDALAGARSARSPLFRPQPRRRC